MFADMPERLHFGKDCWCRPVKDKMGGTLWVMSHRDGNFDDRDLQVSKSLGVFAPAPL